MCLEIPMLSLICTKEPITAKYVNAMQIRSNSLYNRNTVKTVEKLAYKINPLNCLKRRAEFILNVRADVSEETLSFCVKAGTDGGDI